MQGRDLIAVTAGNALLQSLGHAQVKYPSKVITWVCPYVAGGGADSRSLQMPKLMQATLGQTITMADDKAGSAGNKALQDPELRATMAAQGNDIAGGTPEQFAALIKAEAPRWGKVVKDAKIDPE